MRALQNPFWKPKNLHWALKKNDPTSFIATLKVEKVVIRGYVFNLITFFSKNQRLCLHLNTEFESSYWLQSCNPQPCISFTFWCDTAFLQCRNVVVDYTMTLMKPTAQLTNEINPQSTNEINHPATCTMFAPCWKTYIIEQVEIHSLCGSD